MTPAEVDDPFADEAGVVVTTTAQGTPALFEIEDGLSSYGPGDTFRDLALAVSDIKKVVAGNFEFISMQLSDATASARGIIKPYDEPTLRVLDEAEAILVTGAVDASDKYRGQINVWGFRPITNPSPELLERLLQPLPPEHAQSVDQLACMVDWVGDADLRAILRLIVPYAKGESAPADSLFEAYSTAAAAKTMHHAYRGGLLVHSLEVANICLETGRILGLRNELLVTAALLHDIGKIYEMRHDLRRGEYTYVGNRCGHVFHGAMMVRAYAERIGGIDSDLIDDLTHLILSHHGSLGLGAVREPQTPEAVVLAAADLMSSRVASLRAETTKPWDKFVMPAGAAAA